MRQRDVTQELLEAAEDAAAQMRDAARRLQEAVDRSVARADEVREQVEGGGTDAGQGDG